MPGKERRTATKAGRLPPAEKNLAGHLKFMEIGRRCQGKRLGEGGKGGKGEVVGGCRKWVGCMLTVARRLLGWWWGEGAGAAWCILR